MLTTNDLVFNYFLEDESEQFSFIKVPKIFFTDRRFDALSYGAKIVYGLLLDRMSLSKKNNWRDEQGRTYVIYTIESIKEDFGVSKTTAINFMKELEDFGLIVKKKRPNMATMIYVKNFIIKKNNEVQQMQEKQENSGSPFSGLPGVQNLEVQKMDSRKSPEISGSLKNGLPENRLPEVQNLDPNKTNINKTNNILLSSSVKVSRNEMKKRICKCISYDHLIDSGCDKQLTDKIVDCLINIFLSQKATCKIDNCDIAMEQIRAKILSNLSEEDFKEILLNMQENGAKTIHNLQNYVMVCFYKLLPVRAAVNGKHGQNNKFLSLEQNTYDFELLERKLLASQGM